jgi:YHS domain-containing protein
MRSSLVALTLALLCCPALAKEEVELAGACAYGLAEFGMVVETDCSVKWTNPETGKTYCFSSQKSKAEFLKNPAENLRRLEEKAGELNKM